MLGCPTRTPHRGARRRSRGRRSLHHGGEHHWSTLVEQTASMWLDYPGLSSTQIAAIAEPALVLAGDRDQFIPLDLSIALYRALTHAELAICPWPTTAHPSRPNAPRCSPPWFAISPNGTCRDDGGRGPQPRGCLSRRSTAAAPSVPLRGLVRVAGRRWTVEESFQSGKGLVGLDEHRARTSHYQRKTPRPWTSRSTAGVMAEMKSNDSPASSSSGDQAEERRSARTAGSARRGAGSAHRLPAGRRRTGSRDGRARLRSGNW